MVYSPLHLFKNCFLNVECKYDMVPILRDHSIRKNERQEKSSVLGQCRGTPGKEREALTLGSKFKETFKTQQ